ncbi:MAG: nucleotide exchange factor GrpE [Carbonactinosporaceae bacterium]
MTAGEHPYPEEPVIRDKRRLDPETGAVRPEAVQHYDPDAGQPAGSAASRYDVLAAQAAEALEAMQVQLAECQAQLEERSRQLEEGTGQLKERSGQIDERTADLQRLQAEFTNYRRRVERDRVAVREQALGAVLYELLPVLDDIGRAREHGELAGGFKSVAEAFESIVTKLGLQQFGKPGEPFDPTVHEALMHTYSPEATEPTCVEILQPGYRVGERVIRPARVAVAEPGGPAG